MAAIAAAALRLQEVAERIAGGDPPTDPVALLELEQELHRCVARECIDPITEAVLQVVVESDSVIERAAALVASYDSLYLQKSAQSVRIMLLGGSEVTVVTPYYLLRPKRRPGRRRGKGRRGAEGNGVYPRLAVVGIHYRVSPALASEVARLFTLGTVTESLSHLAVRGIQIDCKKLCRLSQRLAERGLAYRDWLMKKCLAGERRGTSAKGKRLVLGVDGGRLRTRVNNGGRPKKSGRRGFDAEWREPKVLVIYEVDAKGRKVRDGLLWYDATLKNADAVFEILAAHLINLGAQETAEWIFISDGAEWIWDRVCSLTIRVGYDAGKVTEIVDFYHASERVHAFAAAVDGRAGFKREEWTRRMIRLLKTGRIDDLLAEAANFCMGRQARVLRGLLGYFENHRERMDYAGFKRRNLPTGSGAVESAVRRIVNLRFKGNGIFWDEENAEGMLHLRAQLLAGHWREFISAALTHEAFWGDGEVQRVA